MVEKRLKVLDRTLAYTDEGAGDPIVFLHGNPTCSYLWRNVLPHLVPQGRCIAPDLLGMGESDKVPGAGPGSYRFVEHYRYLSAFLDQLELGRRVTLVLHDWGSALGFHWAREHAEQIAGIAYMEALVRPLTWTEWPAASQGIFQGLRSAKGEELILEKNVFIERILPGSIMRKLGDAEMAAYRKPFATPGEDRRPMLAWPRELPLD
ncbi:MAG: haloalkane dehalogenase, partial [Gammaproteobacteria bacterium]|nr:haloalkane dehalogenase [Gammaproteobacteria bacterium]